jgi:hypothetical protein
LSFNRSVKTSLDWWYGYPRAYGVIKYMVLIKKSDDSLN